MSYASWSVVFGEQPSAAKWNILGTNDSSFNDGTGIASQTYATTTLTNPYKFSAYRNAAANTGNGAFAVIAFDTEEFDSNNNLSAGVYTAPVNGFYHFSARTAFTSTRGIISLFKNTAEFKRGNDSAVSSSSIGITVAATIQLTAADTVDIRAFGATAVALDVGNSLGTHFSGFLVSKL